MAVERSKPRCFLKLIFIIKYHLRDKKPTVLMSALCILKSLINEIETLADRSLINFF